MPIDINKAHQKYLRNANNAAQDWADGIQNTQKDIAGLAVKAKDKYKASVQASLANDTWAKKMAKVSTADIKAAAAKAGSAAYSAGINNKGDKALKAFGRVFPLIDQVAASVNAMPDTTPAQRDAKMLANAAGLRGIKGK